MKLLKIKRILRDIIQMLTFEIDNTVGDAIKLKRINNLNTPILVQLIWKFSKGECHAL